MKFDGLLQTTLPSGGTKGNQSYIFIVIHMQAFPSAYNIALYKGPRQVIHLLIVQELLLLQTMTYTSVVHKLQSANKKTHAQESLHWRAVWERSRVSPSGNMEKNRGREDEGIHPDTEHHH